MNRSLRSLFSLRKTSVQPARRRADNALRSGFERLEERALMAADTFALIGDYGANNASEAAVANMVKSWNPSYIATLGDNNYPVGGADTIDANVGQYYHSYIGNYHGSNGAGSATNRFFPTLGHHDWMAANAQPYLDYFTLPGNERYYDFVQGSVHFFALDGAPNEPDGTSSTSVQAQWLQNKLATATEQFKVVLVSYPPYSSGVDVGSTPALQWPFQTWGADVVVSGHAHDYERINVGGFTYLVNGLSGEETAAFAAPVAGSLVRYSSDFGAIQGTVNGNTLTFKFYAVTGGTLIDTYTIDKTAPVNDRFAAASNLVGATATASGSNVGATLETGEPANAGVTGGHSVWWNWTAPSAGPVTIKTAGSSFDTTLGVYTGAAVGSLTTIAGNDDVGGGVLTSQVGFTAVAGQVYRISVDGYHGATGSISLSVSQSTAGPANDNFAAAATLSGASATASGSNLGATAETGEPTNAGVAGGKSVWWNWTAATAGTVVVTTAGSSFDTTLGVYTGTAVSGLAVVAGNDDENASAGVTTSRVSFNAVAGQTYRISVDGYKAATGTIKLALTETSSAPANDNFASAIALSGTSLTTTGTNVNATAEAGEPSNAGVTGGRSVWWVWTAPRAGTVTLTTAGSSFDTTLGVYTGAAVNTLTSIASNDDENASTGLFTSRVSFSAVAGQTYRICVDGYHGASGSIALALNLV